MLEFIDEELNTLKQSGLYRELKTIEKVSGARITINGKEYLNFCSNNYLGLANHPKIIKKTIEIIKEFGFGATASRLICGNTVIHELLEEKLANFKGREAAIVFPTGYMANLGTITALVDENDTVIIDRLNHASIINACRLSKAKLQVYPHLNMAALEKILQKSGKYKKRLIVTDHVFSMDGDIAPLEQTAKLAKKYQAITMIDDAHAVGMKIPDGIDIVMGTLSKALGSLGGFVCGSQDLIDYLRNKARSFIYTTALPIAACGAAIAALEVIEEEPELIEKLRDNVRYFENLRLNVAVSKEPRRSASGSLAIQSPIIPIIIGDAAKTMEIAQKLFDQGMLVSGIRPPTVPKGQSRLRITVSAIHNKEELECLASLLPPPIPK
ncbi:8-amino-7-oxononanoate synthase [Candidatus Saganbacteria bacterium CG08_land_8_20_14_0_20_45_16]|uniref:8-amino-7-ketopelargonate synthase n=1 Tax=Candidatus Saganbacteria bacterium CG08_land_8_20_14_0_20_45_16 TaxID=2014293 RepID=A0A2H0XYZ6_UNCSA|nr:MAG: 8-amino-7-oxononanoate synthase [Candidatus Saganbacteria bacterium CG08_land_8_20_14_0_20_45_16]